ncbi:hypothetical protein Rhopal_006940-T1 [Rhodotorula paludigena]|uniref:Uncharacterized protein n=1 Tax=Rhodotorula paludigena TaxID=86838 RepID=A0AAV5GWL8_9BASI|nr:hypothetical protein Rhopal_006940-T1 [Rhodotorula paludigena]
MSYLCVGVPLALWSAVVNVQTSGRYYDYSWSYTHSAWKAHPVTYSETPAVADFSSWGNVIVGFIFFAAFGFGNEAVTAYKRLRWHRLFSKFSGTALDKTSAPAFDISREVGVRHGIKVVVEEEQNIV